MPISFLSLFRIPHPPTPSDRQIAAEKLISFELAKEQKSRWSKLGAALYNAGASRGYDKLGMALWTSKHFKTQFTTDFTRLENMKNNLPALCETVIDDLEEDKSNLNGFCRVPGSEIVVNELNNKMASGNLTREELKQYSIHARTNLLKAALRNKGVLSQDLLMRMHNVNPNDFEDVRNDVINHGVNIIYKASEDPVFRKIIWTFVQCYKKADDGDSGEFTKISMTDSMNASLFSAPVKTLDKQAVGQALKDYGGQITRAIFERLLQENKTDEDFQNRTQGKIPAGFQNSVTAVHKFDYEKHMEDALEQMENTSLDSEDDIDFSNLKLEFNEDFYKLAVVAENHASLNSEGEGHEIEPDFQAKALEEHDEIVSTDRDLEYISAGENLTSEGEYELESLAHTPLPQMNPPEDKEIEIASELEAPPVAVASAHEEQPLAMKGPKSQFLEKPLNSLDDLVDTYKGILQDYGIRLMRASMGSYMTEGLYALNPRKGIFLIYSLTEKLKERLGYSYMLEAEDLNTSPDKDEQQQGLRATNIRRGVQDLKAVEKAINDYIAARRAKNDAQTS